MTEIGGYDIDLDSLFWITIWIFAIVGIIFLCVITIKVVYSTTVAADNNNNDICDTAIGWESNYEYCDKLYDEQVERDEKEHERESKVWKEKGEEEEEEEGE